MAPVLAVRIPSWELIRAEMVLEMARWLAITQAKRGPGHPAFALRRVHLLRSPVWGLFQCSGCLATRAGFDNVSGGLHEGNPVACVAEGLPFAEARMRQNTKLGPLGVIVPPHVVVTLAERRACVQRLTAEFDAEQFGDVEVDLSEVRL